MGMCGGECVEGNEESSICLVGTKTVKNVVGMYTFHIIVLYCHHPPFYEG